MIPCTGKLLKRLFAVLACGLSALAWADQLADIRAAGKLRIAIIDGLPSFSVTDPKTGFSGSDVDTSKLLAADMGVKPEFVFVANAERIQTLLDKRADIILSGLSITPEREQTIAFSVPYSSIAIVVAALRPLQLSGYRDLRGKRVGVGRNTSDGALLKQNAQGANIVEYEDERRLIRGFLDREFDIISCQNATLRQINDLAPADRQLEVKFVQREFQVGIGIRKGERQLREWLNTWVVANLANGRLNEIFKRHHGRDLPESVLPKPVPVR